MSSKIPKDLSNANVVFCNGTTKPIKYIADRPFVIINDVTPVNYRLTRKVFPASDIVTWEDQGNYEKYRDEKYRKYGILYAEDYIASKNIAPETVMAHSPVDVPVEVWMKDLDESCIVMDDRLEIKRFCDLIGDMGREHLFIQDSPYLKKPKCLTRGKFLDMVAGKKVKTSSGMVLGKEILDSTAPPAIILEHPGKSLKEAAKMAGEELISVDDARELAVAYAMKHDVKMPVKSVSRENQVCNGELGGYDYDDDGIREGKHILKISRDDGWLDAGEEYCDAEIISKKEIGETTWDILEASAMVIWFEQGDSWRSAERYPAVPQIDYEGVFDKVDTNCDGAIYVTRQRRKQDWSETSLGEMYSNMIYSLKRYSGNAPIESYMFSFGTGDIDDMDIMDSCGGYESVDAAIDAAYEAGFGK